MYAKIRSAEFALMVLLILLTLRTCVYHIHFYSCLYIMIERENPPARHDVTSRDGVHHVM